MRRYTSNMSRISAPAFLTPSILVAVALAVFSLPFSVQHAQAQSVPATDPLTVSVSPQYPTPYQTVVVTPSSSTFDIDASTVSVKVNGTAFYKGSGGAAINVPLGGPGSSTNIVVSVTNAGQVSTQEVSISPASVALVVEPDSTTHPFYKGSGLVPSEGRVRLVAIPDLVSASGREIDPSTLEYTWKLGDDVLDSDSGIGQSVLDATAPQRYRDADVSVTVSDPNGSLVAQTTTSISPVDPITRIYENDPLLGPLFDTALSDSFTMTDAEDTFRGVPYYFSSAPTLEWMVNDDDSGSTQDLTVRSTGTGTGSADIGFTGTDATTQATANSTLSVAFGQTNSGGFLGL
jgi:ribosomal protein L31